MNKLLICGVDTLVGGNLASSLADRYTIATCEAADAAELTYRVLDEAPQAVIYCGPLSQSAWDLAGTTDLDAGHEASAVRTLLSATERAGSQLAVITTDAIFAGPRLFHTENSPTTALSPAADAGRALEQVLAGANALVLRTHVYGWGVGHDTSFAERVWRELSDERECVVDAQAYATPILATDLAELVHGALVAELHGVYHVTGAERCSQFRFAAELAATFGLTGRQVLLKSQTHVPPTRPFVRETSLNTRAIRRALETSLPMLREGLNRFAEQLTNGYRARLQTVSSQRVREHAA